MSLEGVRLRRAARKVLRVLVSGLLTASVAACQARSALSPTPAPQPISGGLSMGASEWTFKYSPNMPTHPRGMDGGWQFDFPNRNGVKYLLTSQRPASASHSITAAIAIETAGDPFFEYRTEASNTCEAPATVRLFFQRRSDDMSGSGEYEFYRWWSNPVSYRLATGSIALAGDLTDPSQWTSVLGRSGAANEPAFRAALADLGALGFTFGGGCFFGHGVFVAPGTGQAIFKATEYVVR